MEGGLTEILGGGEGSHRLLAQAVQTQLITFLASRTEASDNEGRRSLGMTDISPSGRCRPA
jgi:hypothetical protein